MPAAEATAKSIFWNARDLASPADREAYLAEACGSDAELRSRVERLLAAEQRSDSFLDPPLAEALAPPDDTAPAEEIGTEIGPYKLLERIGEGGMGVVYMAAQKRPVERTVALKIIKPGMDIRACIARFEAERQALALMSHPNIAQVLDAGTTEPPLSPGGRRAWGEGGDRPYFVMELVRGLPITDFCDEHRLGIRERLALFVQVCRAVQHAHQKGVIHRDLKPTNVLVELHDVVPVAKIIDFGVAKAIGRPLTERTLHTGFHQMIGTPMYMSPQQAELSGLDVDTRSDVYSLGVLLYELLPGAAANAAYVHKIRGVDLLVHECYFDDTMTEQAKLTGHSCLTEVCRVAKKAQVGMLLLTHINPLADGSSPFNLDAAKKIFPEILLAEDGMVVEF